MRRIEQVGGEEEREGIPSCGAWVGKAMKVGPSESENGGKVRGGNEERSDVGRRGMEGKNMGAIIEVVKGVLGARLGCSQGER